MLNQLPPLNNIPENLSLEQALVLGANECGEKGLKGGDLYKLLTQDSVMLAFELINGRFEKVEQMKLHK